CPLVVVDDPDAVLGPTQFDRITPQRVLQGGRFRMTNDLRGLGLPDIDHRQPFEVLRLDLGRARQAWTIRTGIADRVPRGSGVGDPGLPWSSGTLARPPSVGEAGGLEPARDRESGSPGVADRESGDPRGTFFSAILALSPGRGGTAVGWRVAHRDAPE